MYWHGNKNVDSNSYEYPIPWKKYGCTEKIPTEKKSHQVISTRISSHQVKYYDTLSIMYQHLFQKMENVNFTNIVMK